MTEALTRSLGTFVSELRLPAIPAEALGVVHTGFADCVGTMIAGSIEEPPRILYEALAPPAGEASLYLVGPRVPAPEAAWINGTAAHALDYDDVALRGHPSTVLVPAILAEGEVLGATGAQLAIGVCRGLRGVGRSAAPRSGPASREGLAPHGHLRRHRRGGGLRLAARARSRQGHAGDRTRCLAERGPGSQLRHHDQALPRGPGRARGRHLRASRDAGFTSSPDALEHPLGFLAATSPKGEVDRTSPTQAGRDWNILTSA